MTPEILPMHLLALLAAPADAVIAVRGDGWVEVVPAGRARGVVVYSRERLLADAVALTPDELAALADRLTERAEVTLAA
ncbi:hypothetical protein DEF23_17375 [Marinitenerispora sediminis]|uniref:Uncharacterized protein n=2 Tax=Marinitenerispora sediminis TaxID=1931232 RepID=A0A368T6K2_9ACTN|nr:hypothetical protein DEF23_17375 [Marinitenerispora sediminis]RCV59278.1 hypothetical protein DEF24_09915 [Marinitenerispora sediminis]